MIGVWGRGERKNYATFQITLYLSVGALVALVGLIALYLQSGAQTFDIPEHHGPPPGEPAFGGRGAVDFPAAAVRVWDSGVAVAVSHLGADGVCLGADAGGDVARGGFEEIRAVWVDPDCAADDARAAQRWMPVLAWLCLGNLVYCGWVAMRQKDFNWMIGYSSVAHMGFVFLGIASLTLVGVTGAVVVMVAHGFLAALTFGLSGYLYGQTGRWR